MKRIVQMCTSSGFILTIIATFLIHSISAQQILSATGTTATSANAQISYTLGEPFIQTFSSATSSLSQGFHTGTIRLVGIEKKSSSDVVIELKPIQGTGETRLILRNWSGGKPEFKIVDMQGKVYLKQPIKSEETILQLGVLPVATYLLHVTDETIPIGICKFTKQPK